MISLILQFNSGLGVKTIQAKTTAYLRAGSENAIGSAEVLGSGHLWLTKSWDRVWYIPDIAAEVAFFSSDLESLGGVWLEVDTHMPTNNVYSVIHSQGHKIMQHSVKKGKITLGNALTHPTQLNGFINAMQPLGDKLINTVAVHTRAWQARKVLHSNDPKGFSKAMTILKEIDDIALYQVDPVAWKKTQARTKK